MKNNLQSLNDYLFEELERLNDDEELNTDEKLDKELKRSKAITNVAQQIINNANVVLEAQKLVGDGLIDNPKMLLGDGNESN